MAAGSLASGGRGGGGGEYREKMGRGKEKKNWDHDCWFFNEVEV